MTVISLTVLMGLVKEAVKGGEGGEEELQTAAILARNSEAYPALALTTLQREVASHLARTPFF